VNKRALCMDKAAGMHVDPGVMAATDAPPDLLKEMIRAQDDVHIGNINSPNQIVLSGNTEAVTGSLQKIEGNGPPGHPLAGQHGLSLPYHEGHP